MKKKYCFLEKRVILPRGGGYYKQAGCLDDHAVLFEGGAAGRYTKCVANKNVCIFEIVWYTKIMRLVERGLSSYVLV